MEWFIGAIVGIVKFALFIAVVLAIAKIFVISRDVDEIKRILMTGRK
ncbi:MAG: hypothetical protein ABIK65_05785 [Candidatus Eisenbacteria bacterium]